MKISKKGQYKSTESTFTGNKKSVLNYLRSEARLKRRESRLANGLEDHVGRINSELHISELVTMASYELMNKGISQLINLLNKHGVLNYKLITNF